MKKKVVLVLMLLGTVGLYAQTGIGTNLPNPTSILDVTSTTKGMLIPRVDLLSDIDKTTIKGGDYPESLIVYHNGTKDLIAGFYYWEKNKWNVLISNTNLYEYIKKEAKQDTVMITQDNGDYIFTWKDDKGVEQTMKISDVIKKFETLTEFKGAIEGNEAVLTYKPEQGVETKVLLTDLLKKSTDFETYIKSLITTTVVVPTTVVANGNGTEVAKTIDTNSNTTTYKVSVVPTEIDLTGDVGGKAGDNTINKIKKVTVSPTPPTTTGQALVYNDATKVWEPGKPTVNTGDITGKADLSTDGIIVVGDATTGTNSSANSVLAATTLSIKKESITSSLIKDGTIELTDMNKGDANAVLTTNTTGDLKWEPRTSFGDAITVSNGLSKVNNTIELGGVLTKATEITTTATNTLSIKGLSSTANTYHDSVLMVDGNGTVRKRRSAVPTYLYMPPISIDVVPDEKNKALDLYNVYKQQFTTPVISSSGKGIEVFNVDELNYIVIYADPNVYTNLRISQTGVLTYDVKATAMPTANTFITVVLQVKEGI
ncbi:MULTISPECIES: hypothetical protein [Myroides]|uniref:hypothetical protein n=1 Tax=Myroides TaxID=76831 RepID=UPI000280A626|nr:MULTISPECIES: hypothetical protein [Myroides]APA93839.1 hypothetical protein BK054_16755 [Myroides sp. ZB35]EKB05547.1 hypothetical protein HMPREF9711_01113 [Myroides odoratimimus CCUG 3837]